MISINTQQKEKSSYLVWVPDQVLISNPQPLVTTWLKQTVYNKTPKCIWFYFIHHIRIEYAFIFVSLFLCIEKQICWSKDQLNIIHRIHISRKILLTFLKFCYAKEIVCFRKWSIWRITDHCWHSMYFHNELNLIVSL